MVYFGVFIYIFDDVITKPTNKKSQIQYRCICLDVCSTEIYSCVGFIVSIKRGVKINQHVNIKNSPRDTRHGGNQGLEIYDRRKILNSNLYFVTTRDVSQQMSIQPSFCRGGATKRYFFGTWRPDQQNICDHNSGKS